jgi:hypothetical protein
LRAIPTKIKRNITITNRVQGNIKGPVLGRKLKTHDAIKGNKRGPQQKKARVNDDRSIVGNGGQIQEIDGEIYCAINWKVVAGMLE